MSISSVLWVPELPMNSTGCPRALQCSPALLQRSLLSSAPSNNQYSVDIWASCSFISPSFPRHVFELLQILHCKSSRDVTLSAWLHTWLSGSPKVLCTGKWLKLALPPCASYDLFQMCTFTWGLLCTRSSCSSGKEPRVTSSEVDLCTEVGT